MVKIRLWKVFLLLFNVIIGINASTHWVVTENGRIQAHLDSPFHLRRPYDLLAFLEQETRRTGIDILYQDLVVRKTLIDKKWSGLEGATDLESRIYSQDPDCVKAGKLLSEIDLYTSIAADGSDREGVEISELLGASTVVPTTADTISIPDCTQIIPLDFSMFTFEHLAAMVNRRNISVAPEHSLEQWLYPGTSLMGFGNQIALALSKNRTSWLHHNLAAIYWRIRGNALHALECSRRAVYLSPKEYRDVALLNLASIFHQARYPAEAAIILHAAIDHAPNQPANHFALGNVYAILADYNRSVACYDNFLKLRPGLEQAITSKHATLCHKKLESGLMELHESLQGILTELHDYHSQQQQWLRLQEKLVWEQAPLEAKLNLYNSEKLGAILASRGQRCGQRNHHHHHSHSHQNNHHNNEDSSSRQSISCDVNDNQMATDLQMDITLGLQMLLKNVESQAQKISEQMARSKKDVKKTVAVHRKSSGDGAEVASNGGGGGGNGAAADGAKHVTSLNADNMLDEPVNAPPVLPPTYPTVMITQNGDFDANGWPTKQQCSGWNLPSKNIADVLPVFLPPENKGYQVKKMLTDYIDLPSGTEHSLPWYPPVCDVIEQETETDEPYLPAVLMKQIANAQLEPHPMLLVQLKQYFGDLKIDEAEIGQRIITATHKKAGPGWLLATLASLYWRVRSNTRNALNCLDLAFKSVPKDHADVILVSIGSVLHQLGFVEEALKVTTLAFTVNNVEPSTNFLLAMLQYAKNNPLLAIYHMKKVVRVDPGYYSGQADLMLKSWACRVKSSDIMDDVAIGGGSGAGGSGKDDKSDGMCSEKDSISGEGVFCTAGGEQCKTAAIQCYRADNVPDDAEIMTLNSRSMSKLLSSKQCTKNTHKVGLGQSLISTLLAAEGSGGIEPDQSQLESFSDGQQQAFHMRISLGDEIAHSSGNSLGDFYVSVSVNDDPVPEAMLHVYDKSGTYPLSPRGCRDIRDADWLHFTSMWQSIAARNIDIGPFLKPLPSDNKEDLKPFCTTSEPPPSAKLDYLTSIILRQRLVQLPEPALEEWLGLMAGDQQSTLRVLGTQIGIAMRENATSWILATAAALYWRVVGNTEQAVMCLRQAITFVPNEVRDIPLISLANVLHRVGFHREALDAAYMALESHPNFVVNHFTVGNIHTSLGDLEKAISFYRSSLALDANFEPARNRLQAILCTLLFDESGSLRESTDHPEN